MVDKTPITLSKKHKSLYVYYFGNKMGIPL